jgi:hypothetical protein
MAGTIRRVDELLGNTLHHQEAIMKGKTKLTAVCILMLTLGVLGVQVSTVSGQGSWSALAGTANLVADQPAIQSPTASPYTEYVYQQTTLDAGSSGAAVAACPNTAIVVGGGYAAYPDVTFYTQYKYENGWRGDAMNNSGSSQQITVYAVCLYNVSGASVTQVHGQVDVPSGDKGQAVAICPAGSISTGGGFHAYPDGSLQIYNSSRADGGEGWQSWARNRSGYTKTYHAYAICLSGSGGTTTDAYKSVDIAPGSSGYAFPKCGSGELVTSGGFAAHTDLLIYSNSGPYSGDEWRVYARNTNTYNDRLLFAYAKCLLLRAQIKYTIFLPLILESYTP